MTTTGAGYGVRMVDRVEWVMLAYRLPREPSTPRITLWRKLRRLGAVQVVDGLVALPSNARTREQVEWLADEAVAAGGEATVWVASSASSVQERALAQRMSDAVASEYRQVVAEAESATGEPETARRRTAARLRRELLRINRRDYFPPPERAQAKAAVARLAESEVTA